MLLLKQNDLTALACCGLIVMLCLILMGTCPGASRNSKLRNMWIIAILACSSTLL